MDTTEECRRSHRHCTLRDVVCLGERQEQEHGDGEDIVEAGQEVKERGRR